MNTEWIRLVSTEGPAFNPTATFYRKVRIAGVQQTAAGQPLKLRIEWAEGEISTLPAEGQAGRWIALEAAIRSQQYDAEKFGEVRIPLSSYPSVRPPFETAGRTVDTWEWMLTVRDAERVDAYRRRMNPAGPIYFNLVVKGQVQLGTEVYPVQSDTQISVEVSEWERYLGWIGYATPPYVTELVTGMISDHPAWRLAELKLASARRLLRAGDTRPALEAVLRELEAICEKPYQDEAWKALLLAAGLDNQKAQGLARWFGGFGTYINKVGHHRDPQAAPDGVVADQWEAELALVSAQVILTEAFRVGLQTRTSQAQPVAVASKN